MLGAVITPVEHSGGPIKAELILCGAEMQPIKPHVHRFGLTRQNCVVSDAGGGGVAIFKGRRCLWTTHFNECLSQSKFFFAVIKMAEISALVAEDVTNLIILEMMIMGPL